ncbi:MAG: 5-aminolevulinate synthase, partial [Bdellovibrionales bacterium]|nr:5-aminolevulinate synthase [Bdellovibrionales bacterium]
MSKQKQQDQSPTCTSHASSTESFQYGNHFEGLIQKLHSEGRYRVFADLQREVGIFPRVHHQSQASEEAAPSREVTVWCSNDYLGMGHNRVVLQAMHDALDVYGAGSGGTRNISGNHVPIVRLERELASLYGMGAGLVCTSGYVANVTGLSTIARQLPGCIVFSDSENHASMIQGIRGSKAKKFVFEHNDVDHLERLIRDVPAETPKLIAFESVYSMSGDFGPIAEICEVAKRYNALTFLDETHAVGLYGSNGAGLAQEQGLVDQIDIIQGSFGKGYGVVGGFLVGSSVLIDVIRSYGTGFIFTTSLPPTIAAG